MLHRVVCFAVFILPSLNYAQADDLVCKFNETTSVNTLRCNGYSVDGPNFAKIWPGKHQSPITFPAGTEGLTVSTYDIDLADYQMLPEWSLKRLTFLSINAVDPDNFFGRFPLRNLVSKLNRASVEDLRLTFLDLLYLEADDFDGFSGLKALRVRHCGVQFIESNTFSPFAVVPGSNLDVALKTPTNQFRRLEIADGTLRSFPWHSLFAFADFIEEVILEDCSYLGSLTLPVEYDKVSFKSLKNLTVRGTAMGPLSPRLLTTLEDVPKNAKITFENNWNPCSSCDLQRMLYWVRNGTSDQPRQLSITCDYAYVDHAWLDGPVVSGDSEFWRTQSYGTCNAPDDTTGPSTPAATSPTTERNGASNIKLKISWILSFTAALISGPGWE